MGGLNALPRVSHPERSAITRIMKKACQSCSSGVVRYIRKDMPHPMPVIFLALGGIFFAMVYGSSQPSIYQCDSCKAVFKKRSILSTLMLPILWVYLLVYACIVLGIIFIVGALIWGAITGG